MTQPTIPLYNLSQHPIGPYIVGFYCAPFSHSAWEKGRWVSVRRDEGSEMYYVMTDHGSGTAAAWAARA